MAIRYLISKGDHFLRISGVNPDIEIGTETWLDSNIKHPEIFASGYKLHRKDRTSNGDEVLIAVKEEYSSEEAPELETKCEIRGLRIRLLAIETFKILHKMTPMYLQDLVSHKTCTYSFRYDNLIDLPRVRTTKYGKSSFCYEAAAVWNSLPNELRKVEDFSEFRRLVFFVFFAY